MQFHQSLLLLSILGLVSIQSAHGCADDATFTFPLNYDSSVMKDCSWLTKNLSKVAYRTGTYCPTVGTKCVKSCSTCSTSSPTLSSAPSKAPTKKPTSKPTLSSEPSMAPFGAPSGKPSAAPSSKPSSAPSVSPSSKPSWISAQPSNKPTQSIKPSATPSKAPIGSPTKAPTGSPTSSPVVTCQDNAAFKFSLTNDPAIEQGCSWLTKNLKKTPTRILNYCSEAEIKFSGCPATCGGCTATCADNATFTFPMITTPAVSQKCSWIAKNNASKRRANYCSTSTIANSCPSSCGFCPSA